MPYASEYLIEVGANNLSAEVTLRYSTCGLMTGPGDTPANTPYDRVISNPGTIVRSIYSPGKTMGASESDYGQARLANVDDALSPIAKYAYDGRSFVLKRLNSSFASYASAETILRATVDGIDTTAGDKELRLRIYDRRLDLEKPLQTNLYGGTTTSGGLAGHLADGNADLKNKQKPLTYGKVTNIKPVLVNGFDVIWQVKDGPVSSITLYDRGIPLTYAGDFPTVAALQANLGTLKYPKYATCLTSGLVMLFASANSADVRIRADVTEGGLLSMRNASQVIQRILAKAGFTGSANIDAASFAAFALAAPQEVGIYITDDMTTADAIDKVLKSIGGWIITSLNGVFQVGRLLAPTVSTWTLVKQQIGDATLTFGLNPDTERNLPAWRVVVRYLKNWGQMGDTDLAGNVSADRRAFLTSEYREEKAENAATLTRHPQAQELVVETLLTTQADAAAEATRLLALYGVDRQVLQVTVDREDAVDIALGSTGTVTIDRLGYDAGRLMNCIGRTENYADETVSLTFWG